MFGVSAKSAFGAEFVQDRAGADLVYPRTSTERVLASHELRVTRTLFVCMSVVAAHLAPHSENKLFLIASVRLGQRSWVRPKPPGSFLALFTLDQEFGWGFESD